MRSKHLFLSSLLALGMCAALGTSAHAQPDINNAPKADNPPNWNWNPGGGGGRGAFRGRNITPEQLQQLQAIQAQMRVNNIKQQLTDAGFADEALQTAVVNEYKAQGTAQTDLTAKWQKITLALRANPVNATDVAALLKDFRDATAKEKARRKATSDALEAQFQVSRKPVLDALLMTMGITGDEAGVLAQNSAGALSQALATLGNLRGGAGGNGPFGRQNGTMGNARLFGADDKGAILF